MQLINNSDREAVIVKYTNTITKSDSTIVTCRIPRIQSSSLPQSSLQCLVDVTIKGQSDQQKSKHMQHFMSQELQKCIDRQTYSGCSVKVVVFISEEGSKLFEGLVNCAVAGLLLYGVAMKRTLLAIQEGQSYVIYNLITEKIVSLKSKGLIDYNSHLNQLKSYKQFIKQWLLMEMSK